ncbi:hypothetical protein D9611_002156 [Ephemerocybe angulata]|uniref:Ion transport domain-containing protein n=1 Tax=Ephemerocybe angulata TaxID=980116 RepID=A0A8H5CJX7_9AGAR|nr:hypothetical protein D9611_002156 [Tulosesus angulatus]
MTLTPPHALTPHSNDPSNTATPSHAPSFPTPIVAAQWQRAPPPLRLTRSQPSADTSKFTTESPRPTPRDLYTLFPPHGQTDDDVLITIRPSWETASAAFAVHMVSTAPIVTSALITLLETVPTFHRVWFGMETGLVVVFTVEYVARVVCWSFSWSSFFRWVLSLYGIIDLLAVLPYYIEVMLGQDTSVLFRFSILRMFCLLRVFRPFRYKHTILLTLTSSSYLPVLDSLPISPRFARATDTSPNAGHGTRSWIPSSTPTATRRNSPPSLPQHVSTLFSSFHPLLLSLSTPPPPFACPSPPHSTPTSIPTSTRPPIAFNIEFAPSTSDAPLPSPRNQRTDDPPIDRLLEHIPLPSPHLDFRLTPTLTSHPYRPSTPLNLPPSASFQHNQPPPASGPPDLPTVAVAVRQPALTSHSNATRPTTSFALPFEPTPPTTLHPRSLDGASPSTSPPLQSFPSSSSSSSPPSTLNIRNRTDLILLFPIAITTVGYGEITPRSFLGRLITLPILVFGLLLITLPSFVLGREFSLVWAAMTADKVRAFGHSGI